MGVALAAIADDDDLLALDQVQVGVAIVINTHGRFLISGHQRPLVMLSDGSDCGGPRANFPGCLVHFQRKGKPVSAWRSAASCVHEARIE
jgi:hypothetical protein